MYMGIQLNREYLAARPNNGLSGFGYEQNEAHNKERKEKFKKNQEYYNPYQSSEDEDIIRIDYGSDQKHRQKQENSNRYQDRREKIEKLKKEILSGGQDLNPQKGFSEDFVIKTRKLAVNKDPNRRNQSMLNSRKHSNVLLVA